jgi:hypothetical protein
MNKNTTELKEFIETQKTGTVLDVATSKHIHSTPGLYFDFYSTAGAVKALTEKGLIKSDQLFRFAEIVVI